MQVAEKISNVWFSDPKNPTVPNVIVLMCANSYRFVDLFQKAKAEKQSAEQRELQPVEVVRPPVVQLVATDGTRHGV